MEDTVKSELAIDVAKLLHEHNGSETIVLDIRTQSSWTDFFVITTATSVTHMQGLSRYIREFLKDRSITPRRSRKNIADDSWLLVDCGDFVIHVMSEEARAFYELERLWFGGEVLYHSSKSS